MTKQLKIAKVEAVIRHWKLDAVKAALVDLGLEGITVTDVRGCGTQESQLQVFRGQEYHVGLPKVKLEVVLPDDLVEAVIEAISIAAHTGEIGDGKIFVYPLNDAVRIRNGNQGVAAL